MKTFDNYHQIDKSGDSKMFFLVESHKRCFSKMFQMKIAKSFIANYELSEKNFVAI